MFQDVHFLVFNYKKHFMSIHHNMLCGYEVARLYGLDTLGVRLLYKDEFVNKYYVEQVYNGMCGREKYFITIRT